MSGPTTFKAGDKAELTISGQVITIGAVDFDDDEVMCAETGTWYSIVDLTTPTPEPKP